MSAYSQMPEEVNPETCRRVYHPVLMLEHVIPTTAAIAVTSAAEAGAGALMQVPPMALQVVAHVSADDWRYHTGAAEGVPEGEEPPEGVPEGVAERVRVLEGVGELVGVQLPVRVLVAVMEELGVPEGSAPSVTDADGVYVACGQGQMPRSDDCEMVSQLKIDDAEP